MRGWHPSRRWWCPMHPWPPAWMRAQWWHYPPPFYPMEPSEELKTLEDLKKDLEAELADIAKRIEDLKRSIQEGEQKP